MKGSGSNHAVPRTRRYDLWDVVIYTVIALISLSCVLPFIHVIAKSLSSEAFVIANKISLWPQGITLSAYKKIFADASIMRSLYISVIITVAATVIGMIVTTCAAYPLSRRNLKGNAVITFIFMFTMYFGGGMIPEYLNISSLGLLDTLWALILPGAFSAFNLLIMKTTIRSNVPDSLEEAARIDGAGHFRILTLIVLPLSKPIIATLSLFYAVGRWNGYMDALFYIKYATELRPLQLKLYYLVVQASESFQLEITTVDTSNPEVLKAAVVVFATVPILCVYPFIQKYFVQGVMIGAVKE
ncbi:carbohydrate ABC transporter permease [Paenibacillus sp. MCAF20]